MCVCGLESTGGRSKDLPPFFITNTLSMTQHFYTHSDDKIMLTRYKSLHELFQHTDRTVDECANNGYHRHNMNEMAELDNDGRDNWRFGKNQDLDRFKEQRLNPSYGRDMCRNELRKVMSTKEYRSLISQAMTYRKKMSYQDTGTRISVPHAVTGEDKYFIRMKNGTKPTVNISINIGASCGVDAEDLQKIAVRAVPIIYALETAGICTNVVASVFVDRCYENHQPARYTIFEVPLKNPQQRFNWTTFAPVFQPGFFRYNFFKAMYMSSYETSGGLGCPLDSHELDMVNQFLHYDTIVGVNKVGTFDEITRVFREKKIIA